MREAPSLTRKPIKIAPEASAAACAASCAFHSAVKTAAAASRFCFSSSCVRASPGWPPGLAAGPCTASAGAAP